MTHVICEPCYDCRYTDCVDVCPVECFWYDEKMLYIDPEECIDCGACIPECPVEAIFTQEEVPEKKSEWVKYIQINADRAKALKDGEKAGTLKTDAEGQPVEGHITAKREDFQRGPECKGKT